MLTKIRPKRWRKSLSRKVKLSYQRVTNIFWYAELSKIIKTSSINAASFCQRWRMNYESLTEHSKVEDNLWVSTWTVKGEEWFVSPNLNKGHSYSDCHSPQSSQFITKFMRNKTNFFYKTKGMTECYIFY